MSFLQALQWISQKTQDNQLEIQYTYHQLRKIPKIRDFLTYQPLYFAETEANPNIQDWKPTLQQVSQIILGILQL